MTTECYTTRVGEYLDMVNGSLEEYLPEKNLPQQVVVDAMRYSLLSGGKRIRAMLALEFCRMCGGKAQAALPFACAIEMLHCYSLIHDDLPCMDDDDLRRGRPSCHIRFGEANALLAGDGLLTLAFDTILNQSGHCSISPENVLRAAGILAHAAGYQGMVGGQTVDIINNGAALSSSDLTAVHEMKTGALIRAAAKMGCLAANADEILVRSADGYAKKIGLSFQIVDDILDITGSSDELGKPAGSDSVNHKTTFATLHGIQKASEMVAQLNREAKEHLGYFPHVDTFIYSFTDALTDRKN